jgi:hypothetical protein
MGSARELVALHGDVGAARAVLAMLAYERDADGLVFGAAALISNILGLRPRMVRMHLRTLAERGSVALLGQGTVKLFDVPRGNALPKNDAPLPQGVLYIDSTSSSGSSSGDARKKIGDTRVHAVIERFDERHRERYGKPYAVAGRHAAMIKRLPAEYDAETLLRAVDAFWIDADPFIWDQAGPSIELFVRRLSRYLAPERSAAPPTPVPVPFFLTHKQGLLARENECSNPQRAVLDFIAFHKSRGTRSRDWNAEWERWCLNHPRRGCPCQRQPTPQERHAAKQQAERELRAMARGGDGDRGQVVRIGDLVKVGGA